MQTIIDNNNVSLFIFEDSDVVSLTEAGIKAPGFTIGDLNSSTATLVATPAPPSDWIGSKYLYNGVSWVLNPEYQITPEGAQELEDARRALIPNTVTQVQAMKALHRAGKKKAIKTMLGGAGNEEAEIAFEYERTWRRDSPFIAEIGPALGMTEAEIDALFVTASEIV